MACATLKRSYEWDPLQSPTGRSPKRRRCAAVMSPSPKIFKSSITDDSSPFGEVASKLTSEKIAQNIREEIKKLNRRRQLRFETSDSSDSSSSGIPSTTTTSNSGLMAPNCRDQPLFTYRQVGLICERMIKERENQIRDEYDRILNAKLAEQYDTFVKFTYDQIQKRYENSIPSYLS